MLIEKMSAGLGMSPYSLQKLVNSASYEYKRYFVPKKSGGQREICHPSRKLKNVQYWLLRNVLEQLPVHPAAMAYRKGVSIADNARLHVKSRYLLRLDLKDFFPSITSDDFLAYAASRENLFGEWNENDLRSVSALLFREGKLTIGAPTSPVLSNALCFDLDTALSGVAKSMGITYSRYADDMFFSATAPDSLKPILPEVKAVLKSLAFPRGLKTHPKKTHHSSRKGRRQVTGIVLGSDGEIHIPRDYKRKIRSMVHHYDTLSEADQVALPGMISYVVGIEPHFLGVLIRSYGSERLEKVTRLKSIEERQRIHLTRTQPSEATPERSRTIGAIVSGILKKLGIKLGR